MLGSRLAPWEQQWAPYDDDTYAAALAYCSGARAVLDIGAGDLRLARQLARSATLVYALEIQAHLLDQPNLPPNLIPICADARTFPFPRGIDTAVLLMRHCTHFDLYVDKLVAAGCGRLITNARWGMGVECLDLTRQPRPFEALALGWYACRCGAAGFRPGPPEDVNEALLAQQADVAGCPECRPESRRERP